MNLGSHDAIIPAFHYTRVEGMVSTDLESHASRPDARADGIVGPFSIMDLDWCFIANPSGAQQGPLRAQQAGQAGQSRVPRGAIGCHRGGS